jgi:hypothetical protein
MPTREFEIFTSSAEIDGELLDDGTFVYRDSGTYLVIGPEFRSIEHGDDWSWGMTRDEAIANYQYRPHPKK